jgi:DNA-directed RNA polymerase sigma subunit (sigma70/sigma32)
MEFELKNNQYVQSGESALKFDLSKLLEIVKAKEKQIFVLSFEIDRDFYTLEKIGYQARVKFLAQDS